MDDSLKAKKLYFWFAIVVIGLAGIWLPCLLSLFQGLESFPYKEIPPHLTTYFLGIFVTGCIDKALDVLDADANRSKYELIKTFVVLVFSIILFIFSILSTQHNIHWLAYIFSLLGTAIALIVWWNVNIKTIDGKAVSILGGEIK